MEVTSGFGYTFDPENNGKRSQRNRLPAPCNDLLPRRKRRKVHSRIKTKATPRKNRPHQSVNAISLECCTKRTCLLSHGRRVIEIIRRQFDGMLYEEQNNYLISLLDIREERSKRQIRYHIKDATGQAKVEICKCAFLKIYGVGKKRIRVLIKKLQPYSGTVEKDQRKKQRNQRRIPLGLKAEVVEHLRSYDRDKSHYAREQKQDTQYLKCSLSVSQLWREFLAKKGIGEHDEPPMSKRSFRNIIRTYQISFRRPRVDTCSRCDSFAVMIRYSTNENDAEAKAVKESHIVQADYHYDRIHYDLNIFPKIKNGAENVRPWLVPTLWVP